MVREEKLKNFVTSKKMKTNNKGNFGGGGQNWNQNHWGQKKQKENMNVIMNY